MTDYATPVPTYRKKSEVFKIAEEYARENDFEVGDRIEALISRLGGRIHYLTSQESVEAEDGSLTVDGPGDFEISISAFTGAERDRFTLAHELGHYVLHSDRGRKRIKAARFGSDLLEWEANWFAAAFLMPENEFRSVCRIHHNDPAPVAAHFLVSPKAAEVRMKALG